MTRWFCCLGAFGQRWCVIDTLARCKVRWICDRHDAAIVRRIQQI